MNKSPENIVDFARARQKRRLEGKRAAREEKDRIAEANRVKFGRPKRERDLQRLENEKAKRQVDEHRRERPHRPDSDGDSSND